VITDEQVEAAVESIDWCGFRDPDLHEDLLAYVQAQYRMMRAALEAAERAAEPLPMETAPMDGTTIAVFGHLREGWGDTDKLLPPRWYVTAWLDPFGLGKPYWHTALPGMAQDIVKPLGWRPLPAAPAS